MQYYFVYCLYHHLLLTLLAFPTNVYYLQSIDCRRQLKNIYNNVNYFWPFEHYTQIKHMEALALGYKLISYIVFMSFSLLLKKHLFILLSPFGHKMQVSYYFTRQRFTFGLCCRVYLWNTCSFQIMKHIKRWNRIVAKYLEKCHSFSF